MWLASPIITHFTVGAMLPRGGATSGSSPGQSQRSRAEWGADRSMAAAVFPALGS